MLLKNHTLKPIQHLVLCAKYPEKTNDPRVQKVGK